MAGEDGHDAGVTDTQCLGRAGPNEVLPPRAEVLTLVDNDHPDARFAVRWDDALYLAGDALQEEAGYDPPLPAG